MTDNKLAGFVQTVLGTVSPETLGPTMTHEHLLINFMCTFEPPQEASQAFRAYEPITLENLGWIRYNWPNNRDNMMMMDEETAIAEALLYKRVGGGTLVDATTIGIGRDPLALSRISRATGLHIVMGAGYYVESTHPSGMDDLTESDIALQIVNEIEVGVGETGVKAGIIGEIGCSWPLTENERKVLRGAARSQQQTGSAILVHPGRNEKSPGEILEILREEGADLSRTIMGHLDRTISDFGVLLELASTGCYLEYDLFGNESSYYPLSDIDMPSDAQRMDVIKRLIEKGYRGKVLIAHDICSNHRLVKYGGHGYGHILQNLVPRMKHRGFTEEDIRSIVMSNPARILTFVQGAKK